MTDPLDEEIFGASTGGGRRGRRSEKREAERTARRRRGCGLIGLLSLVLVAALVAVGFMWVKPRVETFLAPTDFSGDGSGSVSVVVDQGDTGLKIGQKLTDAGVVKTPTAFTDALSATKGDEIQPGTYELRKEMKASAALSMMRSAGAQRERVTVREGLWKTEVFDALAKGTGTPRADYDKIDGAALGLPAAAKGNPEGWLFPATYAFDKGTTAQQQIRQMVDKTKQELAALQVSDANAQRVLTAASIVEAEARHDEDRPKVARVLANRLEKPMRLQLDSTVSYGVQKRAITTSDDERSVDNGYNTYVRDGLPVGPIGNPGTSSVEAVLKPAPGPWLYFVAVNPATGETKFAVTDAEHQANVAEFQRWCQANPGKC